MKLWTVQSQSFWELLQKRGKARGRWREVRRDPAWMRAYVWMSRELVHRGICSRCVAPIWAWHSCGAIGAKPDESDIEALLPWCGQAVLLIELDAPSQLVVLSNYGAWNDVLDFSIDAWTAGQPFHPSSDDWHRVFDVKVMDRRPWGGENVSDIQACLPHVDFDWVRCVKPYQSGAKL